MSRHIENIEITNFKSIRHQKIEGCKRINVFIGYPNVGKSNIIEALSLFSLPYLKIAGSKKLTDFIRVNALPALFYGTDSRKPIHIDINNSELRFAGVFDTTAYYPLKCLYRDSRTDKANKDIHIFFNNALTAKFENLPAKIGAGSNFEILKYHFSPENFKPKKNIFPALIPPFGNNIFEVINGDNELLRFLQEEFAKIKGEYIYDTGDNAGKILKGSNGSRFTLPFNSMADTVQRIAFYMAAIASNKSSVLLFEEPEAHMFPPYIRRFTGEIIFEKDNGNQYFINTHSPFVLDDFLEDAREELSVFLVSNKSGETVIKRLSDNELDEVYQYGVDLFFNIESYLD